MIDFFVTLFQSIGEVEVILWNLSPFWCIIYNLFVIFCIIGIYSMKYLKSASLPHWYH